MYLVLTSAQLIRSETSTQVINNLQRKGWETIPDPSVEGSAWDFQTSSWVAPPPAPVIPKYEQFYAAFMNSNLYQSILVPALLQQGSDVLGNVLTIVGLAMQDAMSGRVPLPDGQTANSLQSAIWLLMSVIGPMLQPADLQELQDLLTTHDLSTYYLLSPPTP